MEFKQFDFDRDRIYRTGKLTHDDFYAENSINDKFGVFLNNKYDSKVECYIKPYGSFSREGDDITSFIVQMLDHNNIYRGYINQVHVNFSKVKDSDNLYQLGYSRGRILNHKVSGYSSKLSKQLFDDAIEFLDSYFKRE